MNKTKKLHFVNLQLFAEGGGTAGGATGVSGSVPGSQSTGVDSNSNGMQYGTDGNGTVQNPAVQNEQDVAARFEEMIKGEFKDVYNQRVQNTVRERLKNSKETVDKYNSLVPTLEMLGKKYGVDASDIDALSKAIEDDDSYYEEEAMEKNMTVEQLKEFKKVEKERNLLKRQMDEEKRRQNADRVYSQWMQEADATKQIYPSFDFKTEMQNPKFQELLRSHIDVKTAYEVIHKDEIIPAAMQFAVQTAKKSFASEVMANGSRPIENGNTSQGASSVSSDVSLLSKAERAKINARVANGERITFG
jgi:hypothetical protein